MNKPLPIKEIRQLYASGKSIRAISKIVNITHTRLNALFREYGISIRSKTEAGKLCTAVVDLPPSVISDYDGGLSIEGLSKKYNCSRTAIRNYLFREQPEVIRPRTPSSELDKDQLIRLYDSGLSFCAIGKQLGVSNVTVKNWFVRYGIPIRPHSKSIQLASPKIAATKLERHGFEHFPEDMRYRSSKAEKEICEYLNSFGPYNFKSDRTILEGNLELDGYDPNSKVAFEYCGLHWHCEIYKPKNYHYNKYQGCLDQGITLFTIFEDEWRIRREQVQAFLSAKLGVFGERLYGRQTKVKEIPTELAQQFCATYHIQGSPKFATQAFAVYHQEDVLAVVTFGPHHRQAQPGLVLNRLCFKPGFQIVGGASKLIKHAITTLDQPIKTWSDNRWTTGEMYKNAGFVLANELGPDYSYTNYEVRKSKQSMKKSITGCPRNQTEKDWCREHKWYRIWDCGKKCWTWGY